MQQLFSRQFSRGTIGSSEVQKYSSRSHVAAASHLARSVDAEPSSPEDLFFSGQRSKNGWFVRAAKIISVCGNFPAAAF